MKTYSEFELASGIFTSRVVRQNGPEPEAAPGFAWWVGDAAWDTQRVVDGEIVSYARPEPTAAAKWADLRVMRDARLAACDWIVTRAAERGGAMPQPWLDYRQALRDVPSQPGAPETVNWPEPPP